MRAVQPDTHNGEIIMSEINFPFPKLPEVKFTKSGYEIRTEILQLANDFVQNEFHSKFRGWELGVERDKETGQVITRVEMPPVPGLDIVLANAEKMYEFVNNGQTKK